MRLVVFHYHDRPGGVRAVIEGGLDALVRALGNVREVTLAGGEWSDVAWHDQLACQLHPVPLRVIAVPELGYLSELPAAPDESRIAEALATAIGPAPALVWAHNLSAGRNVRVLRVLPRVCRQAGATLCFHHHDWWMDGRWDCWNDWMAAGVDDFEAAVRQTIPHGDEIRHWCINSDDGNLVAATGNPALLAGNPLTIPEQPAPQQVARARDWLNRQANGSPVVLLPARFLRRKNPLEAVLLNRWLNPGGVLGITGGPSSDRERPAYDRFINMVRGNDWPVICPLMDDSGAVSMPSLMAAAHGIVLCSLLEGFGLAAVEAAHSGSPIAMRHLDRTAAEIAAAGITFPATYSAVPVPLSSFDVRAEHDRRAIALEKLQASIPGLRSAMDRLPPVPQSDPMDFGCLSLSAQLEVLSSNPPAPETRSIRAIPASVLLTSTQTPDEWARRLVADISAPPRVFTPDTDHLSATLDRRIRFVFRHPLLYRTAGAEGG